MIVSISFDGYYYKVDQVLQCTFGSVLPFQKPECNTPHIVPSPAGLRPQLFGPGNCSNPFREMFSTPRAVVDHLLRYI